MRKNNNRGFTLAELLIVVAIIAVLTAIAIPVFTTQLEKSREATDMSNIRAAYAEVMANYLANGAQTGSNTTATVTAKQTKPSWQNTENGTLYARVDGHEYAISFAAKTASDEWTVAIDTTKDELIAIS